MLFATERYAGPILQPLQKAIEARGDSLRWWCHGAAAALPVPRELRVDDARQAVGFRPDAVFSAANWVPHYLSGCKVQVFHGFNVEKRSDQRGHFRLRGLFDLYCTQGPATTGPFRALAAEHGYFSVEETGWPKLDPLFDGSLPSVEPSAGDRPVILFGSTFTPRLSAAPVLLETLRELVQRGDRYWLLTLHPKCPSPLVEAYRALAGPHARFVETEDLMAAQARARVLVADTSSIVSEFVAQGRPVVTFRNRAPKPHMIDIDDPALLDAAIDRALAPDPALRAEIDRYAQSIHPYRDGRSAERVLRATDLALAGPDTLRSRKPFNLWRSLQIRRDTGYWAW
nr:CDP-glycerol glycerophosphotransferase [Lysobacter sp. CAU 1642]